MTDWDDIRWWLDHFNGTEPLYSGSKGFNPKGMTVTFSYPLDIGSMAVGAELTFNGRDLNVTSPTGETLSDDEAKSALVAGILIVQWLGCWDSRKA